MVMVLPARLLLVLVAGVATLAPLAIVSGQIDSIAECRFTGMGVAGSVSEIVGVNIAANVTAFLCDDPDVDEITASAAIVAEQIATASAIAVANTTAMCFAQGMATVILNGQSLAFAEATAIAESVATASLSGTVCGDCSVAAALFARSYTSIFVEAAANATVTLAGSTTGMDNITLRANAFVAEYVEATVSAYAEILADIRVGVDGECSGALLVVVGNQLDGVACDVTVDAVATAVVQNAISKAVVEATVLACNNADGNINANITVQAIASAMAVAIAEISGTCTITGEARVCAITEAEANATAMAVASAFSEAYLNATNECEPTPCSVDVMVLTQAFGFVLAEATASVLAVQCAGPDDIFNISVVQQQIVEQSARAISSIVFNVTVIDGECNIDLTILAAILRDEVVDITPSRIVIPPPIFVPPPTEAAQDPDILPPPSMAPPDLPVCTVPCVAVNDQCGGGGFDTPAECCDPDFVCVRLNPLLSQCRPAAEASAGVIDECMPPP